MSIFGATDTPVSGEAAPNVDYIEKCLFNNHLTWYCRVWLTLSYALPTYTSLAQYKEGVDYVCTSNIKRTHYE